VVYTVTLLTLLTWAARFGSGVRSSPIATAGRRVPLLVIGRERSLPDSSPPLPDEDDGEDEDEDDDAANDADDDLAALGARRVRLSASEVRSLTHRCCCIVTGVVVETVTGGCSPRCAVVARDARGPTGAGERRRLARWRR
jgi:hypothetical protein